MYNIEKAFEHEVAIKSREFCAEACWKMSIGQKAKVTRYIRSIAHSQGVNNKYTSKGMFPFDVWNAYTHEALCLRRQA